MGDAVIQAEYLTETQWSLWALQVAVGVDTGAALWGDGLVQGSRPNDILRRDPRIVIDGITLNIANAAGDIMLAAITPPGMYHYLERVDPAPGTAYYRYTQLSIPLTLGHYAWLNIVQAQALADVIAISAWGHWQTPPPTQDEQPARVTLDSVVWPPKTRRF